MKRKPRQRKVSIPHRYASNEVDELDPPGEVRFQFLIGTLVTKLERNST